MGCFCDEFLLFDVSLFKDVLYVIVLWL